jgi:hypothetical protein
MLGRLGQSINQSILIIPPTDNGVSVDGLWTVTKSYTNPEGKNYGVQPLLTQPTTFQAACQSAELSHNLHNAPPYPGTTTLPGTTVYSVKPVTINLQG